MIFKRYYQDQLAQASYLIACEATGEAIVVDPMRDPTFYLNAAAVERVRIAFVTETHIHADFLSGSRELASAAGAQLALSAEGGEDWQYGFAASANARLLRDGDSLAVGNVRLTALHTPGHTPEHLSFLTHDFASSDAPIGLLSGDFIFVGDVGRPDLLERAVQRTGTMEAAARTLFHSLQRTTSFPDHLQIWPGHGAGSACGKSLGAMPQSTLGYERLSNWAFGAITEEEFVKEVLDSQPTPPRYFARMKELNRDGVPDVRDRNDPQPLDARDFAAQRREGALIVDTRSAALFGGGHIEGALNVPFNRSFLTWAGSVVPYDRDLLLVVGSGQPVAEVCGLLSLVGLDRAVGYMALDVLPAIGGQHLDSITAITPGEAAADIESGRAVVLDVRDEHELRTGTLNGAINIPLGVLADHMDELPRDKRIVVYCRSGSRSAIAAALLRASGRGDSVNLAGGIEGWSKTGQPVAEVSAA